MAHRNTQRPRRTRQRGRQRQPRRGAPAVPRLPRHEWSVPAGYHAEGGGSATLREVVSDAVPTVDGDNLTYDARVALTLLRIEAQRDVQLVTSGEVIDKARALEEVRRGTPLGRLLVEIELRTIEFLKQTAERQRRARAKRQRARKRSKSSRKAAASGKARPRQRQSGAPAKARSRKPRDRTSKARTSRR